MFYPFEVIGMCVYVDGWLVGRILELQLVTLPRLDSHLPIEIQALYSHSLCYC